MKPNSKPNCPRCKCEKFKVDLIELKGATQDKTVEVIVCGHCGAVISSRDPFGLEFGAKILGKLGITIPFRNGD
jgi:transcription elongation factor Elf1